MCCCDVESCCCCIDLRGGVKALGVIGIILSIIGVAIGIVNLENQRNTINDCISKVSANFSSKKVTHFIKDFDRSFKVPEVQDGVDPAKDMILCGDKTISREQIEDYQKYYQEHYIGLIAAVISPNAISIVLNILLVVGVVKENRWFFLPWLIGNMIGIVLIGVGVIALIVILGIFLTAADTTNQEGSLGLALGLTGLVFFFGISIYFWTVVLSLFRQMAMDFGGRTVPIITHTNTMYPGSSSSRDQVPIDDPSDSYI